MSTLVCVPIMVHDEKQAREDALAARDADADLVEFRIDEVFSGTGAPDEEEMLLRLVGGSPLPCIVTCRIREEGGVYDGDESARISFLLRMCAADPGRAELPPRYIDVEHAAYCRSANIRQKVDLAASRDAQPREHAASLILSMHDFQGRPADLDRRFLRMMGEPSAAVLKVAFRARSLRDNLEIFDLLSRRDRPTIALCMGDFGLLSRVLAPKFGAFLTFASLRPRAVTAPGQPTVDELLNLYRFRSINSATEVYGVIGWPIRHTLSPAVHNAGFEAAERNAVYLPLPIASDGQGGYESFKATLLELMHDARLDFRGASVTLPHKEHLLRLAEQREWRIDPFARRIGAANTLVVQRGPEGEPIDAAVLNTDAPAAVDCLVECLGALPDRRIALLGAGGVARAIALAAADAGANVLLLNRDTARAERVAAELAPHLLRGSISAGALDEAPAAGADVYINCTPLGMAGGGGENQSPIDVSAAAREGKAVFFDTVYNPIETPMLIAARERGARTIDGAGMFIRQAERQFEAFTGSPPTPGLFARIVRERLAAKGRA